MECDRNTRAPTRRDSGAGAGKDSKTSAQDAQRIGSSRQGDDAEDASIGWSIANGDQVREVLAVSSVFAECSAAKNAAEQPPQLIKISQQIFTEDHRKNLSVLRYNYNNSK